MSEPPLRRTESNFAGVAGERLFRRAWLPEKFDRVLVLVHGYAEHSGRYESMGKWFAARGCAVHAYDHRGHGLSSGTRCHVSSFQEYLDDLGRFLAIVRDEHPEGLVTLVGHSMGGLITLAFLAERKPLVSSAITSGPALQLGPGVSWARVAMARGMRRLFPRLEIGSGLDPNGLSRNPEVVRAYLEDPLVFRTMTTSLAAELLAAVPAIAERAGDVEVPLLMLHGEDDPLCSAEGSRRFSAEVRSTGSELRLYPKLLHEIFNEPEREQVYRDMWDWLVGLSA